MANHSRTEGAAVARLNKGPSFLLRSVEDTAFFGHFFECFVPQTMSCCINPVGIVICNYRVAVVSGLTQFIIRKVAAAV
jgi:ABC-type transport system involved in cytochrome bd biosynthesis fused ATPase/permease subunit